MMPASLRVFALSLAMMAGGAFAQVPVSSPLEQAWERFATAQQNALQIARTRAAQSDDPQALGEAYRHVMRQLVDAVRVSAQHDPLAPRFSRIVELGGESGLDNPDTEYQMALIDGTQSYRISGSLNSHRQIFVQSIGGQPGIGDAGPGDIIDTLAGSANLTLGEDGSFEITASAQQPDGTQNWLRLADHAQTILVRFTDSSWDENAPTDYLHIERLCDACPTPPSAIDDEKAIAQLDRASAAIEDRTRSWLGIAQRLWANIPRNGFGPVRETPNGLAGQFSVWGTFDLGPDEAMIITVPASDAPYQGIQLASRYFASLEYRARQSSLTREQAQVDPDGMIRFVVAASDPGVWNWLDTEGRGEGLIMLRWQGAHAQPSPGPVGKVVTLGELASALPHSTRRASTDQRREQLRKRMLVVDRRLQ